MPGPYFDLFPLIVLKRWNIVVWRCNVIWSHIYLKIGR